ncbi:MAG TPA: alpha-ketoacid dehydrogenase subunit beta [Stellaceae bacterium]|nr:alpha-ketoacid dehydrogenase subunit beta [Stellaceae bacterium]
MPKLRYAEALNAALHEEMTLDPAIILFGEDIATYGGIFRVTKGLLEAFGPARVRDTPISEQTLAGMAVGAAMVGLKPVLEIMFADFLPLTLDALINQAAMVPFIWAGQVPMSLVLRTQGGGGSGAGAQHSKTLDSLVAHVPGLKVVTPATPRDAKGLLAAAIGDPNPVVFIEHKLLYNTTGEVPDGRFLLPIGKAEVVRSGNDVSIIANSRMVLESLKAAEQLGADGVSAEVVDLRTLRPLDHETILASVRKTHRAVIVHEGWRTGGIGAEVAALIAEEALDCLDSPIRRVGARDLPIPYSAALEAEVLPSAERIRETVRTLDL